MEVTIYDMNWSSIKDAEGEEIRTLSLDEIEEVSGGVAQALVAALGFSIGFAIAYYFR